MKRFLAICVLAAACHSAMADGLNSLEAFMRATRSARADFTQVVTSPTKEGQAARQKTSSGSFEFQRPGRFRFVYTKPFEQVIVADGQTLWFHDVDLNQITRRSQAQALGSTPAALLASAPDLQALRADFSLSSAPEQDGLQWVLAVPKAKEGPLQNVRVGLRDDQLVVLEILDSFGQRSVIRFSNLQANPSLPPSTFQFKPPAGVDVLNQ